MTTLFDMPVGSTFRATSPDGVIQFQGKKLSDDTVLITKQADSFVPPDGYEAQLAQIQEACDASGYEIFQYKPKP